MTSTAPLVDGLPIIGSALDVFRDTLKFSLQNYRKYGPVFRFRALNREMYVLAGAEANTFISQNSEKYLRSREFWDSLGKQEYGVNDYLMNTDGEAHSVLRKSMKRGYARSTLIAQLPTVIEYAQNTLDRYTAGSEFPALYLMRQIVTDQLGMVAAGHRLEHRFDDMLHFVRVSLHTHLTKKMLPFATSMPKYRRVREEIFQFGRDILDKYRQNPQDAPPLIADLLSFAEDQPDLYQGNGLLIGVLGVFIAGLDTIANSTTFVLYNLLRHPEYLEPILAEVDTLFKNGIPQTERELRVLKTLQAFTQETQRLYPVTPAISRHTIEEFEFCGYRIPKDVDVLLPMTITNFLPELYPDPYKFDIGRFEEPRSEHKQKGAYAPYGLGPHTCLGAGLADAQSLITLATLLHCARFELVTEGEPVIKDDPTRSFGYRLKIRLAERRHHIEIKPALQPA